MSAINQPRSFLKSQAFEVIDVKTEDDKDATLKRTEPKNEHLLNIRAETREPIIYFSPIPLSSPESDEAESLRKENEFIKKEVDRLEECLKASIQSQGQYMTQIDRLFRRIRDLESEIERLTRLNYLDCD